MPESRRLPRPDRRRISRGGRRGADQPGAHPKLLIVEDDPALRGLLQDYFRRCHFQVEAVPDGREALLRVVPFGPHLVVTDLDMPHVDGYQLLARLSEQPVTNRVPVVVFASDGDRADHLAQAGCAAFVAKPAPLGVLLEHIREVLRAQPATLAR